MKKLYNSGKYDREFILLKVIPNKKSIKKEVLKI